MMFDFIRKRCGIHSRKLQKESVPIVYGLIRYPDSYRQSRKLKFRHANSVAYGGCYNGEQKTRKVWFCAECRTAESDWKETSMYHS